MTIKKHIDFWLMVTGEKINIEGELKAVLKRFAKDILKDVFEEIELAFGYEDGERIGNATFRKEIQRIKKKYLNVV